MLALSRRAKESIMIGNDIEISILELKGEQVKIGITAPKAVPIYRKELYLQIQNSNQEALNNAGNLEEVNKLFHG